ncbi:hypothetical protein ARZXY2_3636 [Arthrobacter sp. ZXY-2]|nr:hypothetical protein ARZXY2_3636 [Arthrobacter sp. ZXY-2]
MLLSFKGRLGYSSNSFVGAEPDENKVCPIKIDNYGIEVGYFHK